MQKRDLLNQTVEHIDIKAYNVVGLVEAMSRTAFQGRNLGRAAHIYDEMIRDHDCALFCVWRVPYLALV